MDDKYLQTDATIEFDGVDLSPHLTTVSSTLDHRRGWTVFVEGPHSEALACLMPARGPAEHHLQVTIGGRRFAASGVIVKSRVEDHNGYTGDPWLWVTLEGPPPAEVPL